MALLDAEERKIIKSLCQDDDHLYFLLCALRRIENGGPQSPDSRPGLNPYRGGEFGVQTIYAPTFESQAKIAKRSILRHIARLSDHDQPAEERGEPFTYNFVVSFSNRWAPPSAHEMNTVHADNLWTWYQREIARKP